MARVKGGSEAAYYLGVAQQQLKQPSREIRRSGEQLKVSKLTMKMTI